NKIGGVRGGMVLAAETIEREVFPNLKLNGIVDVSFAGFIRVVDALGCAYVNVDHRYLHVNNGTPEENYSEINLQPGYQKLCYENALSYVRYRHDDSDFVRVARQQDFIRDLREQISPGNEIGQIDTVAKTVGHAIVSTFHNSASELIELAKLIVFSQGKPLRQVPFQRSDVNYKFGEGSYVTSTPALERATLTEFLQGNQRVHLPRPSRPAHRSAHTHQHSTSLTPASLGLFATSHAGVSEMIKAAVNIPFGVLYPSLQTGQATQQEVHPYTLEDQQNHLHHAYTVVWRQNINGGYYDFEGSDWTSPPLFAHAHTQQIDGRAFMLIDDGEHIHVIGWRSHNVLYWLTNTLLEELSNPQMIAIARSASAPH
ncbi:MAG TPA: LCP family protein, partial [Solirubrobacteraceae bacterium]